MRDETTWKLFNKYFPTVSELLDQYSYRNEVFFIVMQNMEAKMILEGALPEFFENHDEPIASIHDGLICRKSSAEELKNLFLKYSKEEFGIPAPVNIREVKGSPIRNEPKD